jgi:hypothetical protein
MLRPMHEAEAPSCTFRLEVFVGELELLHTDSFVSGPPSIGVQFLDYTPLVFEPHKQSVAGPSTTAAWLFGCKSCSLLADPASFAVQLSNGAISMMLVSHLTEKQAQMHGSCSIAAATLVPTPAKHLLHPSTGSQMIQQWGLISQQVSLSDIYGSVVGTINITVSLACLGRAVGAYPKHVLLKADQDKCNGSGASCGHCVLVGEYAPTNDNAEQQSALRFNQQTATVAGVCGGAQTAESESCNISTVQDTISASQIQQQHVNLQSSHHAALQATSTVSQQQPNGTNQQLSQTPAPQTAAAECLHRVATVDDQALAGNNEEVIQLPGNNTLHIPIDATKERLVPRDAQTSAVDYGHALYYSTKCDVGTDSTGEVLALLEAKTKQESTKSTRERLPQQFHGSHRKHFQVQNVNHTKVITQPHRSKRLDSKQTTRRQQSALPVNSVCGQSTKQAVRGHTTRIRSRNGIRPSALKGGSSNLSNSSALIRRVLFDMIQQTYTSTVPCDASVCDHDTLSRKPSATVTAATSVLSVVDKSQLLQCIRAYLKQTQIEELLSTLLGAEVDVIASGAIEKEHQQVTQLDDTHKEQHKHMGIHSHNNLQ